jgi:hypothetical protein
LPRIINTSTLNNLNSPTNQQSKINNQQLRIRFNIAFLATGGVPCWARDLRRQFAAW